MAGGHRCISENGAGRAVQNWQSSTGKRGVRAVWTGLSGTGAEGRRGGVGGQIVRSWWAVPSGAQQREQRNGASSDGRAERSRPAPRSHVAARRLPLPHQPLRRRDRACGAVRRQRARGRFSGAVAVGLSRAAGRGSPTVNHTAARPGRF